MKRAHSKSRAVFCFTGILKNSGSLQSHKITQYHYLLFIACWPHVTYMIKLSYVLKFIQIKKNNNKKMINVHRIFKGQWDTARISSHWCIYDSDWLMVHLINV